MRINLEESRKVEEVVSRHGNLVFFVGFVCRFDPSYAYARKLIDEGAIGESFLVRWFLGSEIKTVYSRGGSYVHKVFEEVNDACRQEME